MTTLAVRAREQAIERRFAALAEPADREVGERRGRSRANRSQSESAPSSAASRPTRCR